MFLGERYCSSGSGTMLTVYYHHHRQITEHHAVMLWCAEFNYTEMAHLTRPIWVAHLTRLFGCFEKVRVAYLTRPAHLTRPVIWKPAAGGKLWNVVPKNARFTLQTHQKTFKEIQKCSSSHSNCKIRREKKLVLIHLISQR